MNQETKNRLEGKANDIDKLNDKGTREMVLLFCGLILFPFFTVRALMWKWHFWLQKMDKLIDEDHKRYNNKY